MSFHVTNGVSYRAGSLKVAHASRQAVWAYRRRRRHAGQTARQSSTTATSGSP
jgi:hypothetical protein